MAIEKEPAGITPAGSVSASISKDGFAKENRNRSRMACFKAYLNIFRNYSCPTAGFSYATVHWTDPHGHGED